MPVPGSLRILVVDDQESMRWIIVDHLKRLGIHQVVQAGSMAAAMAHLSGNPFDLILSDYAMDNGTGLDLLKAVRVNPQLRRTPFIMLTGNANAETVSMVVRAGVSNYLVKPVSCEMLKKRIEQVVGALSPVPGATSSALPSHRTPQQQFHRQP